MKKLVILFVLVAAVLSRAQKGNRNVLWEPPHINWPVSGINGSVIHRLSISGYPIVLDRTSLEKARQRLGGVIGSRGDAGDAESWFCLHGTDTDGPWILWLTSDEINGDSVGGFIWRRVDLGQSLDPRCRSLDGQDLVKLQPPLKLGVTKAGATRFLGAPSSTRDNSLFYMHEKKKTIDATEYTISNGVEVTIRNGTVAQIAAFEISSN